MSESTNEKMAHAFQEQQAQWSAFSSKALESSIRLFELNLKMAKQSLEEASQSARHRLSAKSPEQIFAVDQSLLQERMNQAMAYASEIGAITAAFTTELNHAAQSQLGNSYDKVTQLVEEVKKPSAPQPFFPQFGELNHGYDQWLDASKKIVEAFGHGLPITPTKSTTARPVTTKPTATKASAAKPTSGRTRAR